MNSFLRRHLFFFLIAAASLLSSLVGLRWGTPSQERAALILKEEQKSDAFYVELAEARKKIYATRDSDPAYDMRKGFKLKEWEGLPKDYLKHAYSSYLVRSKAADEQTVFLALSHLNPFHSDFQPTSSYGTAYLYGVGGVLGFAKVTGLVNIASDITYYYRHPEEMSKLFGAARIYSAFCGLALLAALYYLAYGLFGRLPASAACLLMAAQPIFIFFTHTIKPHLQAAAFIVALAALAVEILKRDAVWLYLGAGLLTGLMVGTATYTYPAVFIIPAAIWIKTRSIKPLLLYGASALLVGGLCNLSVLLHLKEFLAFQKLAAEQNPAALPTPAAFFKSWKSISEASSAFFILTGLAGAGAAFKYKGLRERFCAALLALYILWFVIQLGGNPTPNEARFFIGGLAILSLFAAGLLSFKKTALSVLVCVLMITQTLSAYCRLNRLRQDKPGEAADLAAGAWINQNIRKGASIAVPLPTVELVPPFHFENYDLRLWPPSGTVIETSKSLPQYFLFMEEYYPDQDAGDPVIPYPKFSSRYVLKEKFIYKNPEFCGWMRCRSNFHSNYRIFIYHRSAPL